MVANENPDRRFDDVSLHHVGVQEAFAAGRAFGTHVGGKHFQELRRITKRIDHLVLREARVHANALHGHRRRARVEVFVFEGSDFAAVEGVGVLRAEAFDVEVDGPAGHLFVGRKADRERRMRDFGMRLHVGDHRHDGGDARLVVGAEKRRAVREDHVFARVLRDFREVRGLEDDSLFGVENHVAPFIAEDLGLDTRSGRVGRSVHVGDEADRRAVFAALRRRNERVDHAPAADTGVFDAELLEFGDERFCKAQLLFGGRGCFAFAGGLRVKAHVAQKTGENGFVHFKLLMFGVRPRRGRSGRLGRTKEF